MVEPARERASLVLVWLVAATVFGLGLSWGLPTRAVDPYLFGDRRVWTGRQIADLAPADTGDRGADVDANPILNRDATVALNDTDRQRAEIVRRYRLFSNQPDEMITFKSLSRIREHHGDPRLYQYGGLWIYPVGMMLRAASIVGLVDVRADQAYYLDHPEAFGRFYLVARVYSALWGLVAVWAVFWIVRRLDGGLILPAAGAICFACMPVVVNAAHEAKPHLAGLALTLLAVIAAAKYVETGRARWGLIAGALCGAAFSMVLSMLLSFAVIAVMVILRRQRTEERLTMLAQATAIGLVTYALFNPFVVINLAVHRDLLRSNLGNSTAMYAMSLGGVRNAIALIAEGASPIVMVAGLVGGVTLAYLGQRRRAVGEVVGSLGRGDVGWLLAGPAVVIALQFLLLASQKPAEYARFALVPDAFLLVAAFAAIGRIRTTRARITLAVALPVLTFAFGLMYVIAFVRDCSAHPSRLLAAERIRSLLDQGVATIGVIAEPAPYDLPPVDLFRGWLLFAPPGQIAPADAIVELDPGAAIAPISWADAHFSIALMIQPRPKAPAGLSSRP
jgi:hypothetical protein